MMATEPTFSMMLSVEADTDLRTSVQASPIPGEELLGSLRFGWMAGFSIHVDSVAAIDSLIDSLRELRRKSLAFLDQQALDGQPSLLDDDSSGVAA